MSNSQLRPHCVGFIMDGNRRWATDQGKDSLIGHVQGEQIFSDVVHWVQDAEIPHAVFYAFSTENWNRSEREVAHLMNLAVTYMERMIEKIIQYKLRVKMLGRREGLPEKLIALIEKAEKTGLDYTPKTTIWIALSYGGRAEIVDAVNQAIEGGQLVTEESLQSYMWGAALPEPDLVIRTGGEQRVSNFLLWHIAYSELYFTDTYWPAFTKDEFHRILEWYESRQRRRGR